MPVILGSETWTRWLGEEAGEPVVLKALLAPYPADQMACWPGQSGNPGGRTKAFAECQALCREASLRAAQRLIELMESNDERVALLAAEKVIERGWGRPRDYDPKDDADANRPKFDPRLLSGEQLNIVMYALRLMQQATRPLGEVETVIEQEPAAEVDPQKIACSK